MDKENLMDVAGEENRELPVWENQKQKRLWNLLACGNLGGAVYAGVFYFPKLKDGVKIEGVCNVCGHVVRCGYKIYGGGRVEDGKALLAGISQEVKL